MILPFLPIVIPEFRKPDATPAACCWKKWKKIVILQFQIFGCYFIGKNPEWDSTRPKCLTNNWAFSIVRHCTCITKGSNLKVALAVDVSSISSWKIINSVYFTLYNIIKPMLSVYRSTYKSQNFIFINLLNCLLHTNCVLCKATYSLSFAQLPTRPVI